MSRSNIEVTLDRQAAVLANVSTLFCYTYVSSDCTHCSSARFVTFLLILQFHGHYIYWKKLIIISTTAACNLTLNYQVTIAQRSKKIGW